MVFSFVFATMALYIVVQIVLLWKVGLVRSGCKMLRFFLFGRLATSPVYKYL